MRRLLRYVLVLSGMCGTIQLTACSLKDLVAVRAPEEATILTRDFVESKQGSIGVVLGGYNALQSAINSLSRNVGIVTDELVATGNATSQLFALDARSIVGVAGDPVLEFPVDAYQFLQTARIQAMQGRDLLTRFADDTATRYKALAFAVEGYAVLLLAENFCSGVPLSRARYGVDITYAAGASTTALFQASGRLFDSAIATVPATDAYASLARVGRMRAYLGQGELDSAFAQAASIAPDFLFSLAFTLTIHPGTTAALSFWTDSVTRNGRAQYSEIEVINREGGVGRTWYSRSPVIIDPRVPMQTATNGTILTIARPRKFFGGAAQFPLARGLEATLVEAEYALAHGGDWLSPLNTVRRQVGLADTTAPVSHEAAVDLLFSERAAWHYLEGRRLGDLRRLIRQYGRDPYTVYPGGAYLRGRGDIAVYGNKWVFTPDSRERRNNALYEGCDHQNP